MLRIQSKSIRGRHPIFETLIETSELADAVIALDRIISAHLYEADAALSNPLERVAPAAAGDWYVAVDGTDADAVGQAADQRFGRGARLPAGELIAFGAYRLLWDLAKAELDR